MNKKIILLSILLVPFFIFTQNLNMKLKQLHDSLQRLNNKLLQLKPSEFVKPSHFDVGQKRLDFSQILADELILSIIDDLLPTTIMYKNQIPSLIDAIKNIESLANTNLRMKNLLEGEYGTIAKMLNNKIINPNFWDTIARSIRSQKLGSLGKLFYTKYVQPHLEKKINLLTRITDEELLEEIKTEDPNFITLGGEPLLFELIERGNIELIEQLLKKGLNPNYYGKTDTPLLRAIKLGKEAIIKLLITYGANPNLPLPNGRTLLTQLIIENFNPNIIKTMTLDNFIQQLKEWGVDLNQPDELDELPLYFALGNYQTSSHYYDALLQAGVDINARNSKGRTALMSLAAEGKRAYVSWLLKENPDATLRDNNGKTAADLARDNNHSNIARMIEDYIKGRDNNN